MINPVEGRRLLSAGKNSRRRCIQASPSPLALPLVLAAIAHLVVAALPPVHLIVLVVADKAVSEEGVQNSEFVSP